MGLEDDIAFFEQVPTFAVLGKQALRILAIGAETRIDRRQPHTRCLDLQDFAVTYITKPEPTVREALSAKASGR